MQNLFSCDSSSKTTYVAIPANGNVKMLNFSFILNPFGKFAFNDLIIFVSQNLYNCNFQEKTENGKKKSYVCY